MLNFLSNKKQTITLSKTLELKKAIESKLISNHNIFKLENSVIQGQKRSDLKKICKESEILHDQLVTVKLLIQEANLRPADKDKKCVSYYVYLLSEKKQQLLNLQATLKEYHAEGPTKAAGGKVITYSKPFYTRQQLEDWINTLKKECKVIEEETLTNLNNSIIVELPFKTNLV